MADQDHIHKEEEEKEDGRLLHGGKLPTKSTATAPRPCPIRMIRITRSLMRSPPRIPEVSIPDEPVRKIASALRSDINIGFTTLRDIASGRDLKKFLGAYVLSLRRHKSKSGPLARQGLGDLTIYCPKLETGNQS